MNYPFIKGVTLIAFAGLMGVSMAGTVEQGQAARTVEVPVPHIVRPAHPMVPGPYRSDEFFMVLEPLKHPGQAHMPVRRQGDDATGSGS